MHISDIDLRTVKKVINQLGREFYTKDVSENAEMRHTHSHLVNEYAYHSVVGRVLGRNVSRLKIMEIAQHTTRGSLWRKI